MEEREKSSIRYSDFGKAKEHLLKYCDNLFDNKNAVCLEDPFNQLLSVSKRESASDEIMCYSFKHQALRCASQIVQDCFDLGKNHWYGGYETFNQIWPLKNSCSNIVGEDEEVVQLSMTPYITGDFGIHKTYIGNVLERLFISSTGIGIFISRDSPLHISFNAHNDNLLCIAAKYDEVHYFNLLSKPPVLEYTVCKTSNVKNIYDFMKSQFIHKPEGRPNTELFHKPIWSTWAQYNRNINQSSVIAFADNIIKYGFPCSQLEIDDRWSFQYGDFDFDSNKFPDPKKMMAELTEKGFTVTLWFIHFLPCSLNPLKKHLAKNILFCLSLMEEKLAYQQMVSSNDFSALWVKLAFNADPVSRRQEVRVGWNTQRVPVFVRLFDRMSSWGRDGGLATVIPSVLTLGLIGYPFILPDMIGGNAYADAINFAGGAYPDRELYIRWLELNTFLPSLQFSVVPWIYDYTVIAITKKFLRLREEYADVFVALADESVSTGNPIIRPLWWIVPFDELAMVIDDQFLLGDNLLVAPVVKKGARSRNIYLPQGLWSDKLRQGLIHGPTTLINYTVELDELAFFEKKM